MFHIRKYARIIFEKKCISCRKMKIFHLLTFIFQLFFVPLHAILCAYMKIILVIALVAAAMLLLSVGVIFRKDHSFRSQHIHENERMRKDHIHCSTAQDKELRRKKLKQIDTKKL